MVKIDLITGFLGAGKTTFLKKYAAWLMKQGLRIGILENDFGAVNVDMMLLRELEGENCELEMVSGGCDAKTHRRRFRTKLIAMGMSGFDRVLVEPSGIYDVDEFFDTLREEPLDRWYEIGSVIAVADAKAEKELPEAAEYVLASETACAGLVLASRSGGASREERKALEEQLNRALEKARCSRRLSLEREILCRDWEELTDKDFARIASCGWVAADYVKRDTESFDSLFFMNVRMTEEELLRAADRILRDPACGQVFRLKGFLRSAGAGGGKEGWTELNATRQETELRPAPEGQEILIAIGEGLQKERIEEYLQGGENG